MAITLVIFSVYWLCTFLYVTPSNPVRIEYDTEMLIFASLFYQKWTFFAPPPQFNTNIYYTFTSTKNSELTRVFDVSSPILNSKRQTLPLNEGAEVLDYMIFGAVDSVSEAIHTGFKYNRFQGFPQSDEDIIKSILTLETSKHPNIILLKRYGEIVASRNGINLEDYKMSVTATRTPLPTYSNKNLEVEDESYPKPELMFKTL